ncbi:hypothetical protein [Streptomyces mobaraensis]|uniref:Uncharacterized protein n=1 Tax=Streptomyces mobaraensis TaxID=35621 RepID=A0A5N5VZD2_STRMB|nr:hypothetical protein [Streptomyces mobaraensis]KAB7833531.1 hypothetical protein FRZ00_33325 [Streptomyces mobaraensis]
MTPRSDPAALLLPEAYAVQRLQVLAGDHDAGPEQMRTYLLRRAVLDDRLAPVMPEPLYDGATYEQDAVETGQRLLDHDRTHHSHRGPVPAGDPRWDFDLLGYVRQEHAVLVREEHDTEEPTRA